MLMPKCVEIIENIRKYSSIFQRSSTQGPRQFPSFTTNLIKGIALNAIGRSSQLMYGHDKGADANYSHRNRGDIFDRCKYNGIRTQPLSCGRQPLRRTRW